MLTGNVLVFSDGKGGIKWKIYYLPDQTKKRTVRVWTFLASANAGHKFANGVLTDANTSADSTALPKAVINALQGILSSAAAAGKLLDAGSEGSVIPAPQLYKIVVSDDMITLCGGAGDIPVRVSLK